jgi:hypothetical protein
VADDLRREGKAGRHQERRPEDGVEAEDVLADEVGDTALVARGPVARDEGLVAAPEAEGGEVVRQGVEPDVDDVPRVARERNPPLDGRARDGEVLQPGADEGADLVEARLGEDERDSRDAPLLVKLEKPVLVLREAEEDVLFLLPLGGRAVRLALSVDEVLRGRRPRSRRSTPLVPGDVEVPAASRRRISSVTPMRWRGSVVRMKSSLATPNLFQRSRKVGACRSATSIGATPSFFATFSIF